MNHTHPKYNDYRWNRDCQIEKVYDSIVEREEDPQYAALEHAKLMTDSLYESMKLMIGYSSKLFTKHINSIRTEINIAYGIMHEKIMDAAINHFEEELEEDWEKRYNERGTYEYEE